MFSDSTLNNIISYGRSSSFGSRLLICSLASFKIAGNLLLLQIILTSDGVAWRLLDLLSHVYWLLLHLVLIDSLVLYHWLLGRRGPERQLTLVWSLCLDLLPIHELTWGSKIVCLVNLHSILNSSICGLANKMFSYLIGYSLRECLALHLGLMYLWVVDLLRS